MKKEQLTTTKNNVKINANERKEREILAISLLIELNAEQLDAFINFIKERKL